MSKWVERLYEGEIENRAWAEATGGAGQRRGDNKTLQIDVSEMDWNSEVSVLWKPTGDTGGFQKKANSVDRSEGCKRTSYKHNGK